MSLRDRWWWEAVRFYTPVKTRDLKFTKKCFYSLATRLKHSLYELRLRENLH